MAAPPAMTPAALPAPLSNWPSQISVAGKPRLARKTARQPYRKGRTPPAASLQARWQAGILSMDLSPQVEHLWKKLMHVFLYIISKVQQKP